MMTARFPSSIRPREIVGTSGALMAPVPGRIRDAEDALRRAARR